MPTKKTADSNGANRDTRGRFRKGNPGGPGNPHIKRLAAYKDAIRKAVSAEDLTLALRVLVGLAKSGDLQAIRELLDRTVGKPSQQPSGERIEIELPPIRDAAAAVDAANIVLSAVGTGRISMDAAGQLISLVETARRTIETHELATRIAALELEHEGLEELGR